MPVGQLLIEGLAIGACYGLFATAVVIIYKTSEVVNFAQGEMAMFSTFVAFHILTVYQYPFWVALIVTLIFSVVLGIMIEYLFLRPAKHPTILGLIVITLGAEMFLMGLASWKWGAEQQYFNIPLDPGTTYEPVAGMVMTNWTLAVLTVTVMVITVLYIFFNYTKLGVAMRATQQNKLAAKVMGIRTERILSIAWGFSALIGSLAGMFFASRATLDPVFMMEPFMRAFAGAVLGGLMSIPGVIVGGVLMGLIENFFGFFWPHWKPIIAFIVIILILCIKPSGLFTSHYVKKV